MTTSPIAAGGAPSDRPICGAAVMTIVPSSISMKKQPATSRAVLRCVASITGLVSFAAGARAR